MKRILLHTLLTAGLFLLASGSAFAQRHEGGGGNAREGGREQTNAVAPAHVDQTPAVRSEIRTNQPVVGNNQSQNHPFYGNEHGQGNDWRYGYHDNRWWYWTAANAWAYWADGRWQDYAATTAVPYTTNYRGPVAAPTGWYWNNDQQHYYWFDGTNLTAAQQ